jgi:hypothetical protein
MRSDWCALGRCTLKTLQPAILLADAYVVAEISLMDQVACRVQHPGWRRKDEVGKATLAGDMAGTGPPATFQASADVMRKHRARAEARPDANQ